MGTHTNAAVRVYRPQCSERTFDWLFTFHNKYHNFQSTRVPKYNVYVYNIILFSQTLFLLFFQARFFFPDTETGNTVFKILCSSKYDVHPCGAYNNIITRRSESLFIRDRLEIVEHCTFYGRTRAKNVININCTFTIKYCG